MKCPYCGKIDSEVIETRVCDEAECLRRRRECTFCKKRFTTYERVENIDLLIVKKDGRREKFSREKLRNGIVKACDKRPVSAETVNEMVNAIERDLKNSTTTEVPSKLVGNMVLKKLKSADKVAYVRFASVYLDFNDLTDFEKVIDRLQG